MSADRESVFAELSKFLEYYSTYYKGIARSSDIHPSNILVKIIEQFGRSKALEGLKQAINDTIEDTQGFSPGKVSEIDFALKNAGIISLSALRQKYWAKYKTIISRKMIKNETEYYLAVGLLNNASTTLSSEDQELLMQMVSSFEEKHA